MSEDHVDLKRRQMLTAATSGMSAVGIAGACIPFVKSMSPSARARAAGAPVEVDISNLRPGEMLVEEWRGKPVWILRRTPEMLETLAQLTDKLADPDSAVEQQPGYCQNESRASNDEYLVVIGICTHLGCAPTEKIAAGGAGGMGDDWLGGFFCPCHGSKFDLAGRVYKNVPAPTNLVVPPHKYLTESRILVGVDQEEGAA